MKRRSFLSRASLVGVPLLASTAGATSHSDATTPVDSETANVRIFGAIGDGVHDDSEAIQAAVDTSSVVFFPPGNYLVRSKINLRSGSSLIGNGGATLRTDGTGYILSAAGKIGQRLAPRRDARAGETLLHAAMSSGQAYRDSGGFFLQSDRPPLGHPTHCAGELGTVTSVDGDELRITGLVLSDYLLNENALLAPVDFVDDISIQGLHLTNDNYSSNPSRVTSAMIYLEFARNFRVAGCSLRRNNGAGIAAFNCLDGSVSDNTIAQLRDGRRGILGYGVQIGFSSQNISVSGNNIRECRHAVTTGTGTRSSQTPNYGVSRNLTITGNTVSNCTNAGLDTHEDSDGVTISNNCILSCSPVGIHVRSYRSVISGNAISSCTRMGIRISSSAYDTLIIGNSINAIYSDGPNGDGISVESRAATITGNRVTDCDRHGIAILREASRDIAITGNSCANNGRRISGDGINIGRRGPISRLTVAGNTCVDFQDRPTQRFGFAAEFNGNITRDDNLVANNNFSSIKK